MYMKRFYLKMVLALCIAIPCMSFVGHGNPIEIYLEEIPTYQPQDNIGTTQPIPDDPNNFTAYISGRTLSVTSSSLNTTRVVVINLQTSQTITNRQFYGLTNQQIPSSGYFRVELYADGQGVGGYFSTY